MIVVRPIRLAIYFDQIANSGGGYQQALSAALLVLNIPKNVAEPIYYTSHKSNVDILKSIGIDAIHLPTSVIQEIRLRIRNLILSHFVLLRQWRKYFGANSFENHLLKQNIDLVYFVSPTHKARDLEEINYVTTVWDLCHRDELEFPEVRSNRIFEWRETNYRSVLPKAVGVIVDSELGKMNVIRRYGIDEERVHIIPFSPAMHTIISESEYKSNFIDIKKKYDLKVPYVYYPAQFWPHKNHIYLLRGLKCLEQNYGCKIGAIFSGENKGNLEYIKKSVSTLKLDKRVIFTNYVSNEEIPYLYKQSLALVMPTYFGPTNIPPLEAFLLEVPVIYPDRSGLRDQVKEAALLMDLNEPNSLADLLFEIIKNPTITKTMVSKGKSIIIKYTDKRRIQTLEKLLCDYQIKRSCWE